jgi:hypothetical protein
MKRVLRATLKWGLVAFLCFVVVLVLFYWEEDWRGARDWANCQKELAAQGEILDLRTLCPPGNPKDDLSKVPIFAEEEDEARAFDALDGYRGYRRISMKKY